MRCRLKIHREKARPGVHHVRLLCLPDASFNPSGRQNEQNANIYPRFYWLFDNSYPHTELCGLPTVWNLKLITNTTTALRHRTHPRPFSSLNAAQNPKPHPEKFKPDWNTVVRQVRRLTRRHTNSPNGISEECFSKRNIFIGALSKSRITNFSS